MTNSREFDEYELWKCPYCHDELTEAERYSTPRCCNTCREEYQKELDRIVHSPEMDKTIEAMEVVLLDNEKLFRFKRLEEIMKLSIPKQMGFLLDNNLPPTWEVFSQTLSWKETVDNLRLTKVEQEMYRNRWEVKLKELLKSVGLTIQGGKLYATS